MQNSKIISVSGMKFVDRMGHEVILHGINMVCKEKDRNYIGNYSREDFQMLRQWGVNVIRLGIFWDAAEPEAGKYDEWYFDSIDVLLSYAQENQIVVYLDMHQDLFSYRYADGAPEWATLTQGAEHIQTELWSESYLLSPAVQTAFDQFWSDAPAADGVGIQTHFIRLWRYIAARYAENETVIGYDFFNEPFPGTMANQIMMDLMHTLKERLRPQGEISENELMEMWLDPEKKLHLLKEFDQKEKYEAIVQSIAAASQEFDRTILNLFYQRLGDAVREVDKTTLLFTEANYFSNSGMESAICAITDASGKPDKYQVFSPHGYDLLVDTDMYEMSSYDRLRVIFEAHKRVQERLRLPMLVGEWGCFPNAGTAECKQAEFLLELFSEQKLSDTYFDFSHIQNNRILQALVRPYPMCVAGELLPEGYSSEEGSLICAWKEDPKQSPNEMKNTRIYIPNLSLLQTVELLPLGDGWETEYCNLSFPEAEFSQAGYLVIPPMEEPVVRSLRLSFQTR